VEVVEFEAYPSATAIDICMAACGRRFVEKSRFLGGFQPPFGTEVAEHPWGILRSPGYEDSRQSVPNRTAVLPRFLQICRYKRPP